MLQKRAELVLNVVFVTDIIVLNAAWTNVSIHSSRINTHDSDITTWKDFFLNNTSSSPLWRAYNRDNTTCSTPLTCAPRPERWLPASAGLVVADCSHWEDTVSDHPTPAALVLPQVEAACAAHQSVHGSAVLMWPALPVSLNERDLCQRVRTRQGEKRMPLPL